MNLTDVLTGTINGASLDEQKAILEEMKNKNFFELNDSERNNLVDFLVLNIENEELILDYLFHVLDNQISYPDSDNDEKMKEIFSEEKMKILTNLMVKNCPIEEE